MPTGLTAEAQTELARARAVRARGMSLPPEGQPSVAILDSWVRCTDQGLIPGANVQVPVFEAAELARRRARSEFVRRLAQAELETLSRQIAGSNFLLAFADQEGVILDLYADNRFSMSSQDAGILAGSLWTEGVAGTNGLGTALATGSAVAVTGLEHYFLKLGKISCTAAPVRDAYGQVVGVLDASSYYESRQKHTQALVQMAAVHIENGLLTHQMRGHLVLALHPRREFLGTLSAGLLAFDGAGRLVAVNGSGRHLLAGLEMHPGTGFDELFGEPLDHVLARLFRQPEVKLRDVLGSALVARVVVQPRHRQAIAGLVAAPALAMGPVITSMAAPAPGSAPAPHSARVRGPAHSSHTAPRGAPGLARHSPAAVGFVAEDAALREACHLIEAAVRMRVPILLHGETGSGKELMARHAHRSSGRSGEFVAVNCAAVPAELFEAELFGYAGGAYTGARREGSPGLVVAADGGTLLLDEIRELPLPLQACLLRFLDDQVVRPVGGLASRRVDVQLIAASHADLEAEVRAKTFREDLMYRLNTVRVSLPPLRQRSDFAQIVRWLLRELDASAAITDEAVQRLAGHRWPGNFRELRSILTRSLLVRSSSESSRPLDAAEVSAVLPAAALDGTQGGQVQKASVLQRSAGDLVRAEYARNGGSVSQTSRALGISRTTVYRHLRA